jgi:hypothetical protein
MSYILEQIVESNPESEFLKADGFDDAVIGYDYHSERLIYSYNLCLKILRDEGMEEMDAIEHLSYNTLNAYVGEKTPIWCMDDVI